MVTIVIVGIRHIIDIMSGSTNIVIRSPDNNIGTTTHDINDMSNAINNNDNHKLSITLILVIAHLWLL